VSERGSDLCRDSEDQSVFSKLSMRAGHGSGLGWSAESPKRDCTVDRVHERALCAQPGSDVGREGGRAERALLLAAGTSDAA